MSGHYTQGVPNTNLADQIDALRQLVALADGRSDVSAARAVLAQADTRLSLTTERTVVALAGATGSGKSSLFNAITGTELATPGVLRPTTSATLAAVFSDDASDLLDWLQVSRRHRVHGADGAFDDLVLLDLPDHDSTERAHATEVERLVKVVDQIIWVVDPQKYADAALHDGFLRPMAGYQRVLHVALNQVDKLDLPELEQCYKDLRLILDAEGLTDVPIFPVSARTGAGVPELRKAIMKVVAEKEAAISRIRADVGWAVRALAADLGQPSTTAAIEVSSDLTTALAESAGMPAVVQAVEDATLHRGAVATGWPGMTLWRRLRPDPLRRLRLGEGASTDPKELTRSALPRRSLSSAAMVDNALRQVGQQAGASLPPGWRDAVLESARTNQDRLPNALDQAIVGTDLGDSTQPGWWRVMQQVQIGLLAVFIVGLLWWLATLLVPALGANTGSGWSAPIALLVVGLIGGILLGLIARGLVGSAAKSAAARARKRVLANVEQVARDEVISPINQELANHNRAIEIAGKLVVATA